VCWKNVITGGNDEDGEGLEEVREQMKLTGRMLARAGNTVDKMDGDSGIRGEIEELVRGVEGLGELFGVNID
jgi:hypothetical protein